MHAVAEFARTSGRQLDGNRFVRIGEIVDVDPIGRPPPLAGSLLKNLLDRALGAHAARPDDEQVEARLADAGSELDRVESALLTDKAVRRLDVGCRLERKRRQIGRAIEPLGQRAAAPETMSCGFDLTHRLKRALAPTAISIPIESFAISSEDQTLRAAQRLTARFRMTVTGLRTLLQCYPMPLCERED